MLNRFHRLQPDDLMHKQLMPFSVNLVVNQQMGDCAPFEDLKLSSKAQETIQSGKGLLRARLFADVVEFSPAVFSWDNISTSYLHEWTSSK